MNKAEAETRLIAAGIEMERRRDERRRMGPTVPVATQETDGDYVVAYRVARDCGLFG